VDDYGAIRRARRDGKSIRQIARDYKLSRNTIRHVLKHPEPNGTDQEFSSSIEQEDGATHGGSTGVVGQVRTQAPLGTLQNTRSQMELSMWRGEAWHGRAGQAFELFEPGVIDGATANSSPQTTTGHFRMTRASRRSPYAELLADSGSGPGPT